jgi:hypothetical protein
MTGKNRKLARRQALLAWMATELQIIEMSMGWRYMLNSPLNRRYEALKAAERNAPRLNNPLDRPFVR